MAIVKPEVRLLAHTTITPALAEIMKLDPDAKDAENLIEFAGRSCYQSFHKPNEKTRRNKDYIQRTVFDQGHGSIAEHATATLYFTGVSRAFTHELVRHRHFGYSQLSQRFVDEGEANFVMPPALRNAGIGESIAAEVAEGNIDSYRDLVNVLSDLPRKQAREAARAILPNMVETRIVVTGNMRAWKEAIDRRTAPDADAEIQEVMGMANTLLAGIAPTMFGEEK